MAEEQNSGVQPAKLEHPCLAKVISHLDTGYMGTIQVQLLRPGAGNDTSSTQTHTVRYMSPFWGNTSVDYVANQNDYNNTQKSYGMWMIPPDVGAMVVVIFLNGDSAKGYWIGCVPDDNMNFMVPGIAATQNNVEGATADATGRLGRVPVAEYNKLENEKTGDTTQFKKPTHPFTATLQQQGLLMDDIRGITTSSARREVPSMVFGISTPGPFDKQTNAKTGKVGKSDSQANNVPVSHLGGSSFVMDDGDDKFLRKTPASAGGPEYAAVEQGDSTGDVTIPHNELIRIRTRTGHQILLHNSEDLIYIGNSKGTVWIELTSNGKIDIYAEDSISVHTKNDINFTADKDINFNAGGNINLVATGSFNCSVKGDYAVKADGNGLLTVTGNSNINAGGNHVETAGKIFMNGPTAAIAGDVPIIKRIPQAEPWNNHENLDPSLFTPDKTGAYIPKPNDPPPPIPKLFGQYSTITDTFNKVTG